MNKLLTYSLFVLFFLSAHTSKAEDTLYSVFRPRIGLGTGVMTYYGEVQNYEKNLTPLVNRFGGMVYVNAPLSRMFNLEFSATYVKIAANERTLERNFNFESRIRMGTAMLYYNFYPLFQAHRSSFNPFIGTGFASFEFLSKTDLLDANGNAYFYWSDGSIMNMDENDPLAATDAVPLTRDYTYETDLRELDADGLGKYREQSFAFPLSIGAEWHMSPRWDFRLSATYYFTFSDLVDNISPAGTGIREGDKNKDRLLFTYASLSYDLQFGKKGSDEEYPNLIDEDGIELFAEWDPNDFDKDGVIDALDECPATPLAALVDERGCPIDSDGDGVPDYRDEEPDTELGSHVDEYGIRLTEEDFERHARLFYDSTGYEHDFDELRTEVVFNREDVTYYPKAQKKKSGLNYVIVVGKEQKDVTVNDLHSLLGYKDYSTIVKGDTVYYTLGAFNSIEEAVAAKSGLEEIGIEVQNIGRNSERTDNLLTVDDRVVEKVERINIQEGRETHNFETNDQLYRIQLGAFRNKIDPEKVFPGLDIMFAASDVDNINRYYTGSYTNYDEAEKARIQLENSGYQGTFIVAYKGQKRVTLQEAGVTEEKLPENYSEEGELATFVEPRDDSENTQPNQNSGDNNSNSGEKTLKYRVQLAYFEDEIPVETVDILYNIKRIKPVRGKDGSTTYYSREFDSKEERDAAMDEYRSYGLENVMPVIEHEGVFYSDDEYNEKFNR